MKEFVAVPQKAAGLTDDELTKANDTLKGLAARAQTGMKEIKKQIAVIKEWFSNLD